MCNCASVRGRRCWSSLNKIKTHTCSVAHNLPFAVPLPLTPHCALFWEWLIVWICTLWSQFGAKSRMFAPTQFCTPRNWMNSWHHCTPLSLTGFRSWDFVSQNRMFLEARTTLMLELHRLTCGLSFKIELDLQLKIELKMPCQNKVRKDSCLFTKTSSS